jgi:hypothetical protein
LNLHRRENLKSRFFAFIFLLLFLISQGSSVVQCGIRAGWSEIQVPAGNGNFFLYHCVQTGSGAHPASYPMGNSGSFLGGKAAGSWSWPLISI